MARRLVVAGGKKPQMRKASRRSWTKAKQHEFLSVLAETCNVSEACRRSGASIGYVYEKRKRDAAFRAGWLQAISAAYQRLELVLLERAFNGTEKLLTRRDGSEERMREYSNQLGLALLKMHRDIAVDGSSEVQPDEEMRERLLKKLMRLKKRIEKDEADKA
jgi:hypothetical protein